MDVHQHQFTTVGAITALAARFGLPTGPDMQDWEYQVADHTRTEEFLSALERQEFTDDERFIFTETVMECFETLARLGLDLHSSEQWRRFVRVLRLRPKLHVPTLFRWADFDTPAEDSWSVAPAVRQLCKEWEPVVRAPG